MGDLQLRLPDDLLELAAAQARAAGVSLNEYLATAIALRLGAQNEAGRHFAACAARARPEAARWDVLARAGQGNPPLPGGEYP